MGKINQFLLEYVNRINTITGSKSKTIKNIISKSIEKEIQGALALLSAKEYAIKDLFHLSVRQKPSHFVTLKNKAWDPISGQFDMEIYSLNSQEIDQDSIKLHKNIFNNSDFNTITQCHPLEFYQLVIRKIETKKITYRVGNVSIGDIIFFQEELAYNPETIYPFVFSEETGLIVCGENLMECIKKIELLIFQARLAIIHTNAEDQIREDLV